MFDHVIVPLACPECSLRFGVSVGWLKVNDVMKCEDCGTYIEFKKDVFDRKLADRERLEAALTRLRHTA